MNLLKNLTLWMLIIVTVAMLYDSYGNKFDYGSKFSRRFSSTFFPYKARIQGNGSIAFTKSYDGHFYIQAQINNQDILFLLDTGATDIILSKRDAESIGVDLQNIKNFKKYETAKGRIEAGIIEVPQIEVGNFTINNVQVSINTHSMSHSLLGMSFLKHFNFIIQDNKLILYRKHLSYALTID